MLFQWESGSNSVRADRGQFLEVARAAESTRKFASQLFEGAVAQAESNDKLVVNSYRQNWRLDRLAAIDRDILRLAIYELRAGTRRRKS